jgi:hypothetical protein
MICVHCIGIDNKNTIWLQGIYLIPSFKKFDFSGSGPVAANAAPSGGATVDAESRTAINSIRAALTAAGVTL